MRVWAFVSVAALRLGIGGHSGSSDDCNGNKGGSGNTKGWIAEAGQCDGDV